MKHKWFLIQIKLNVQEDNEAWNKKIGKSSNKTSRKAMFTTINQNFYIFKITNKLFQNIMLGLLNTHAFLKKKLDLVTGAQNALFS